MIFRLILPMLSISYVAALPSNVAESEEFPSNTVESTKGLLRIFKGDRYDIKKNNYTLALLTRNNQLLGGAVLIKNEWALTAAWNVFNVKPEDVKLRGFSGNCFEKGHISTVESILVHPNYTGWDNNLALLKLKVKQKKAESISIRDSLPQEGDKLTITGWGSVDGNAVSDGLARKGEAELMTYDSCKEYYSPEETFSNHSFCTRNRADFGPCYMDYGNPIVYEGALVGLFSGSLSCSNPKYPAVHTDVTQYKKWVEKETS